MQLSNLVHRLLIALCIYPALGIAAFGAAIAWIAESGIWPGLGLWFAGGLLVYNLDRGIGDPSDAENTPHRDPARDQLARRFVIGAAVLAHVFDIAATMEASSWRHAAREGAIAMLLAECLVTAS